MQYNTKHTFYAVGSRTEGVLYVLTNPFRVGVVTREEIETFASNSGMTFDEAFDAFAKSTMEAISQTDAGDTAGDGETVSGADFCFVAEVDMDNLVQQRNFYPPAQLGLLRVTEFASPTPRPSAGKLREAVVHSSDG